METSPGAGGLRVLRLLVALLALLGVTALAPQLASADTPGAISGTVENAAGADVPSVYVQLVNLDNGDFYSGTTGSDGTYTAGGLTSGHYQVSFFPAAGQNYVSQYYPDKPDSVAAQPVLVTGGQTTSGINATFATGATVSGQVTDAAGHPVPGASVNVYDYGGNYPSGVNTNSATTDSNGDWSVDALPTGTYEVTFNPPNGSNYASQFYNDVSGQDPPTPVTLTAGSTTPNINAALTVGGQISGTVTDGMTNAPAAGVDVEAVDAAGYQYADAVTDSQGHYTLSGLSASASYRVEFFPATGSMLASEYYPGGATPEAATPVPVTVGQTTSNIDETLSEGGSISGAVTAAATGYPIAGVTVRLTDDAGQQVSAANNADTQRDGVYEFTNLPPGAYKVQFSSEGALAFQYYQDASTLSAATSVNVTAGQAITNVNAALTSGGTLEGTVTEASTGQGVPDAYVDVVDAKGNLVTTTAFTDPNGHYEVSGIAPGTYYVEIVNLLTGNPFNGNANYQVEFYGGSGTLAGAAPVTITAGAMTAGIDITLAPPSATPPNTPPPIPPATVTTTPTTTPPAPPTGHVASAIPGPPTLSGGVISGLGKGKPVVKFRLASGSNGAPKLRSFRVRLPQGLAFVAAQLRGGVKVTGGGKVTEKLSGGQLVVTLGSPVRTVTVSISSPALRVSAQLSAKAANRRAGTLRVMVTVTPVNQAGRLLSFTVKNAS